MTQAARTACLFIIRQYTKKLYVVMITDKYNSIIMTAPATVEEISLEYIMTVDQGALVPSWRIIVDDSTAQIPYKCCVRFDALTGKELIW